MIARYSTIH